MKELLIKTFQKDDDRYAQALLNKGEIFSACSKFP